MLDTRICSSSAGDEENPIRKGPPRLLWAFQFSEQPQLLNRIGGSFEAVHRLLQGPLQYPLGVIAISENVITGRETMLRAFKLHFVQLRLLEIRLLDRPPVVRG
jgi:hypothetical protein